MPTPKCSGRLRNNSSAFAPATHFTSWIQLDRQQLTAFLRPFRRLDSPIHPPFLSQLALSASERSYRSVTFPNASTASTSCQNSANHTILAIPARLRLVFCMLVFAPPQVSLVTRIKSLQNISSRELPRLEGVFITPTPLWALLGLHFQLCRTQGFLRVRSFLERRSRRIVYAPAFRRGTKRARFKFRIEVLVGEMTTTLRSKFCTTRASKTRDDPTAELSGSFGDIVPLL